MQELELFGSPLVDTIDLGEMFFKFVMNFIFIFTLIRGVYYPANKSKEYLFIYFLFNFITFFLCLMLSNVKLSLGFAFGLFAVFAILRYRTEAVPIKEMTYLFMVITLALINSLYNKKVSISEIALANSIIILTTYVLEKDWLFKKEFHQFVRYEKIDLLKKNNNPQLIEDLKERTGLNVHRVEIQRLDFLRDIAIIKIFYYQNGKE